MQRPSFNEDHISQIPALQLLQKLGYTYLSPAEALAQRGGKTSGVLLEGILEAQLRSLNSIQYKGQSYPFSDANITAAIHALRSVPLPEGLMSANMYAYDLLTLGKALEQSIEGDKKSYTLQYINWREWDKNVFHVTEEFRVMRTGSQEHYRPDIVLFVNGIPLAVIECKRPDLQDGIRQAISQHLRNQQEDGIRPLFAYSQLLLSLATNVAVYGTTATEEKFWSKWEEQHPDRTAEAAYEAKLSQLKQQALDEAQQDELFAERYGYVRRYFEQLSAGPLAVIEQDRYLYCLCRPERLLDLTFNYIVFDSGTKKIARYQQFFAIRKSMQRVRVLESGKRQGGVIWHTQGSGKSLTMVMLAQALAMDEAIRNPKIVIVTDRVDLDDQIYGTFQKCQISVLQAKTGKELVELLASKSDAVITTIINKFETAVKQIKRPFESSDIFVLVDEGHRTQYGTFNVSMEKVFPNACFLAFTGTPLSKKEKNTARKFGGIIDAYTVHQAVEDGAVVSLLYEGRHAIQQVNENPIDAYFQMISEPLNDYQRADMKKKFSRADQLNVADQKIYCIAWDISRHFPEFAAGSDWKGQLVCQSKSAAIRYKKYLDEIGKVTTEIVMSPPDMREGEDSAYTETSDEVKRFWKHMMDKHSTPKKYEHSVINGFKYDVHPQIIIVVDKLLTGFDVPRNAVLYITRSLREHTLLQAIARVNRVHPGKDFGYVIDYYGVLRELDEALKTFSGYDELERQDLEATFTDVNKELEKLPQVHSELWDFFKTVPNKYDEPAYENLLRDEAIRVQFYDKLSLYARLLKLALATLEWNKRTPEKTIERYKYDLGFFAKLRNSVRQRYADVVDYKSYEDQIQKLIDKHVTSHQVDKITELVNIFDTEKFEQEVERVVGAAAQADTIAHRTAKHIHEKMEEDPAFYKRFSEMLKETIRAYDERRISEAEYLKTVKEIQQAVINRTGSGIPEALRERLIAQAFYGVSYEFFKRKFEDVAHIQDIAIEAGLGIDDIIRGIIMDDGAPKVDWQNKFEGQIQIAIGDFLIDEVRDKHELPLSFGDIDEIAAQCMSIAEKRYR